RRKLEQVLDIVPGDLDTLVEQASIAQAVGDLPQAAILLAPLHPALNNPGALETQLYQAILERHPEQVIPGLKEILAKPDPGLGYYNAQLRFWLGLARGCGGGRSIAQADLRV